jgi:hypothetical protein
MKLNAPVIETAHSQETETNNNTLEKTTLLQLLQKVPLFSF